MTREKELGDIIKSLREQQNWTQQYLAGRVGVSVQTIKNWESGDLARFVTFMSVLCHLHYNFRDFIPCDPIEDNKLKNILAGKKVDSIRKLMNTDASVEFSTEEGANETIN